MLQKIHIRLTLLCTVVTSLIFITMTLFYLFVAERNLRMSNDASFEDNVSSIIFSLENQTTVYSDWIRQTEENGDLFLYLYDNGNPILHNERTDTAFQSIITSFIDYCTENDINNHVVYNTYSFHTNLSFTDSNKMEYKGSYIFIPKGTGYIEGYLLASTSGIEVQIFEQRLLFVVINIAGCIFLIFFFWFLTKNLLKPVKKNQQKQVNFIENASHELRSPLAVILSNVSALRKANDQEKDVFYKAIFSEGDRMSGLINSMLMLARSDITTDENSTDEIELDTLLMDMYESYEALFLDKKVSLKVKLPEEMVEPIKSDSLKVKQIIGILLSNALSYTPNGGVVTLSLLNKNGHYFISVADTGIGIPDQDKEKVFERFYRTGTTIKGEHHYGLGLSIAHQLITDLHGSIKISDTPGGGSTFTIIL